MRLQWVTLLEVPVVKGMINVESKVLLVLHDVYTYHRRVSGGAVNAKLT